MSLLKQSYVYKPFLYPWAMEFGTEHDLMHWVAEELKFVDDIRHWQTVAKIPYEDGLLPEEKSLIGNILKLFTTSDVVVAGNYCDVFIPVFKNNEIRQMLLAFANIERVHQKSYALLNDTLAIDEGEYAAFTSIPALHNKVDFMSSNRFHVDFSKGEEAYRNLALALVQTVINEGVGLFSSFAMLMNVTRKGKMPTMGKVVELSVRDEDCFPGHTEILTPSGWVRFDKLSETTPVAQFDLSTDEVSFVTPLRHIKKPFKGNLTQLKNEKGSICVAATPNHEIPYEYFNSKNGVTKREKKTFTEFKPFTGKHLFVSGFKQEGSLDTLSLYEKFMIALQADGSLDYRIENYGVNVGYKRATFTLVKPRKIERLKDILDGLGWDYRVDPVNNREGYVIFYVQCPLTISKTFDWVDLAEVTANWGREFVQELMLWDGHDIRGDGSAVYYSSVVPENLDMVQAICAVSGLKCTRSIQHDGRSETYSDVHRCWIYMDEYQVGCSQVVKSEVSFDGDVYCVTVPTGNIVIRHEGKVIVTGNCHCKGMTKLFRVLVEDEHRYLIDDEFKREVYDMFREAIRLEDAVIDAAFELGGVPDMTPDLMKTFIRHMADRRLVSLGFKANWGVETNPLPWFEELLGAVKQTNFFELRPTEYAKTTSAGDDYF